MDNDTPNRPNSPESAEINQTLVERKDGDH